MNTNIVHIARNKVFTDTLVIAEQCQKNHKDVIALVRKFSDDFEELGRVAFETRTLETKGGKQEQVIAELNEDQATYLITLFRNTDIVRRFKIELVKAFRKALDRLNDHDRKQAIQSKRDAARPMTDMLKFCRDTDGKKTSKNHYSNEHLFCNRAAFGKWLPVIESDLDAYDARLLDAVRNHNTLLIARYPEQKDRKPMLEKFVTEYKEKRPRLMLVK